MIADLHALTVPKKKETLSANIHEMAASIMSCGFDQSKTATLFLQSQVLGHTELAWILASLCQMKKLAHMPQWRDKVRKTSSSLNEPYPENMSLGLFAYPVLMASDVLLFDTDEVPVGPDQITHLEITRELARSFNNFYKTDSLKIPKIKVYDELKIYSLQDPNSKMSKSDSNLRATISILDPPDDIKHKIKRAQTDSLKSISYDPKMRPGLSNLIRIYSNLKSISIEESLEQIGNKGKAELKASLADSLIEHLSPIQKRYNKLIIETPELVSETLKQGSLIANSRAQSKIKSVLDIIGCSL
ncbi:hypothetical protein Ciccas_008652 [Cichlidogyrus casuarinus]|uniref:tryptophan--tRNA ligase n=1 Tax=Cichlidogyrus casuarinus TaxID=1844966 RepID=A0ABD2Q0P1_9PLAT